MTKKTFLVGLSVMFIIAMAGTAWATSMVESVPAGGDSNTLVLVFGSAQEFDQTQVVSQPQPAAEKQAPENSSQGEEPIMAAVPEPSTIVLVSLGVIGLLGLARRKR